MKKLACLVIVSLIAALPAHAVIKQVTTVGAAASTIITPSLLCHTIIIQNNGAGGVRLAIDGGTTNSNADPTATTGYRLAAGTQLILTYTGYGSQPQIRAILEAATTTTLDIVTDDAKST